MIEAQEEMKKIVEEEDANQMIIEDEDLAVVLRIDLDRDETIQTQGEADGLQIALEEEADDKVIDFCEITFVEVQEYTDHEFS